MTFSRVRTPPVTPMHRGPLPAFCCRHVRVDGLQRLSGRTALPPAGTTPHSPSCRRPATARSWTEISMGARAHTQPIAPARRLSSAPRSALRARPTGDRTAAAGAQSQRVIRGRARGPHRQQTSTRGGLDRGAAAQISRSTERTRTGPARWPSLRESSMSSRWWLEPGQACVGGGRHGGRGGV